MVKISIEDKPKQEDTHYILDRLKEYNRIYSEDDNYQPLAIFLRQGDGKIVGGLTGGTWWGWLHIELLWLEEDLRGQGFGSDLMAAAEAEALRRGCQHVMVDTHDFQAPEFYKKLGYETYAVLDDFPPGHHRIFYQKKLG